MSISIGFTPVSVGSTSLPLPLGRLLLFRNKVSISSFGIGPGWSCHKPRTVAAHVNSSDKECLIFETVKPPRKNMCSTSVEVAVKQINISEWVNQIQQQHTRDWEIIESHLHQRMLCRAHSRPPWNRVHGSGDRGTADPFLEQIDSIGFIHFIIKVSRSSAFGCLKMVRLAAEH